MLSDHSIFYQIKIDYWKIINSAISYMINEKKFEYHPIPVSSAIEWCHTCAIILDSVHHFIIVKGLPSVLPKSLP